MKRHFFSKINVTNTLKPVPCPPFAASFLIGLRIHYFNLPTVQNIISMKKILTHCAFLLTCIMNFINTNAYSQNCDYDVTPPRFTYCPTNIVIITSDSFVVANWAEPIATDNCGTPNINQYYPTGYASGSRFREGTTPITYTATDARYNYAYCRFTVTVTNLCRTDTTRPTITNCPTNVVVVSTDSCAVVRWSEPRITDNCGIPTLTASHTSGKCS
jgi:hypothetical protein